ncbi:GFA family protein [Pseudooceanicola sp. LIPI14-2-Ac024]|uniref:GFA family protein n=1 Tax=Pseudooceanicola sp. LIPI14-2-Ac024 TaxID=3344875 RepID=UPI0035D10F4D
MRYAGGCHCGAIAVTLDTDRAPEAQILGRCQCSFCRKHNARTFSDPGARVSIALNDPGELQLYAFGLRTARQVLCRRCGVYVAMLLSEGARHWSVLNIDTLDDRAAFVHPGDPRDYDAEDAAARIARRKARWTPTVLDGWSL